MTCEDLEKLNYLIAKYRKEAVQHEISWKLEKPLAEAVNKLIDEYERAIKLEYVNQPLAYALYQTWKHFDKHERSRNRGLEKRD